MANTLRVWFSGLCQFIDNKDPGEEMRTCVVLVNAEGHKAGVYTIDPRGRDRSKVLKDLLAELKNDFVTFRIKRAAERSVGTSSLAFDDFGVVELQDLVGDFADGDPDITGRKPPENKVVAQVFLQAGRRGSNAERALVEAWELPNTVTEEFRLSLQVADPVFIEIGGIESVDLVVTNFGSERPRIDQELTANQDGDFEVIITNNCMRPQRFFEWRVEEGRVALVQIDRDFRHHYRLLHERAQTAINGLDGVAHRGGGGLDGGLPAPEKTIFSLSGISQPPQSWNEIDKSVEIPSERYKNLGDFLSRIFAVPVEVFGAGVGSGCDCLPCGGRPQFFESPKV